MQEVVQTGTKLLQGNVPLCTMTQPSVPQDDDVGMRTQLLQHVHFSHGYVQILLGEGFDDQGRVAILVLRRIHDAERTRPNDISTMVVHIGAVTWARHAQQGTLTSSTRSWARLGNDHARRRTDRRSTGDTRGIHAGRSDVLNKGSFCMLIKRARRSRLRTSRAASFVRDVRLDLL